MRRRLFDITALLSLGICAISVWAAAIEQTIDNDFGPPGLQTIGPGWPQHGFQYVDRMWYAVIPWTILPMIWALSAIRRRQRWRSRASQCINCGYNLTGNASGICPECGRAIA